MGNGYEEWVRVYRESTRVRVYIYGGMGEVRNTLYTSIIYIQCIIKCRMIDTKLRGDGRMKGGKEAEHTSIEM